MKNNLLISLSGGLDSITLAYFAKKMGFYKISAISFNYNQRHKNELEVAKRFAERLEIEHKVLDATFINQLGNSFLTNVEEVQEAAEQVKNTFVPGRNLFFIGMLATYAFTNGYNLIGLGVNKSDFNGYPDCRTEFLISMENTVNMALGTDDENKIRLYTPFQYHTKAQIFEEADKLGILDLVNKETVTCYNGIDGDGCGKCPACEERARGYLGYRSRLIGW